MPPSPRDRETHGSERPLLSHCLEMEQDLSTTNSVSHQSDNSCSRDHYSSLVTTDPGSSLTLLLANNNNKNTIGSTSTTATHTQPTSIMSAKEEESSSSPAFAAPPYRHLVLPSDTLTGLCLAYGVSKQALQRANPGCCVSSDGLRLTVQPGDRLNIPHQKKKKLGNDVRVAIRQNVDSHEYKLASVLGQIPGLTTCQVERYLKSGHGKVDEAVRLAQADQARRQQTEREWQEKERQRKQDALEIQRILLEQRRQARRAATHDNHHLNNNNTDTELTRLTGGSHDSHNNHSDSHGSLFLDQPVDDNDETEKKNCVNHSCLAGCYACLGLVIFEWIRLSIHIV
uniref:LysM domain-containing protein n=1 Tax=Amphora coffeiformis TaxID=265554 RepID=A0A7S3P5A5_9STRA